MVEELSKIKVTYLVSLFVLIAFGSYCFWQTRKSFVVGQADKTSISLEDVSSWKTYKNDQYGFEINIPKDWIVQDKKDETGVLEFLSPKTREYFDQNDKNCAKSITNCIQEGLYPDITLYLENFSDESGTTTIKSLDGISFGTYREDLGDGEYGPPSYTITNKGKTFTFVVIDDKNKNILSTFKFINSTSTIDTSNWKTYKNDKYGFVVKYPQNYEVKEYNDNGFAISFGDPVIEKEIYNNDLRGTDEPSQAVYIIPSESYAELRGELGLGVNKPFSFTEDYFIQDSLQTYLGKISIDGKSGFEIRHCEENDNVYTIFKNIGDSFFVIRAFNTDNNSYCNDKIKSTKIEPHDSILSSLKFTK